MAGIWVYSEDKIVEQQLLTIGRSLADSLKELLIAVNIIEDNSQDLILRGADKAIMIEGNSALPESYAESIAEIADKERPTAFLIGGTLRGKETAAKIAAKLKVGLVNSALSVKVIDGNIETERILYGGLAVCTETLALTTIVTIEPRTYDVAQVDSKRTGITEKITVEVEDIVTVGNVCPILKQGVDITAAEKLICVGRGLARQEDLNLAQALAKKIGAEIGCTRSIAEDYHWLPNETYIGLSGQKVKPQLYISMGVSGQVQHTAGIRDSKLIVAIDTNENAPIFAVADYGIVGDLQDIVPILTEKIVK